MDTQARDRYAALYRDTHADVLRFVLRRSSGGLAQAEDVTAEVFLVAWRRLADVPTDPIAARAYLYAIARNCLLTEQRSASRRESLQVRLRNDVAPDIGMSAQEISTPGHADAIVSSAVIRKAWDELSAKDQEVLALATWESPTSAHAGQALGITAATYRMRLKRARAKFGRALQSKEQ